MTTDDHMDDTIDVNIDLEDEFEPTQRLDDETTTNDTPPTPNKPTSNDATSATNAFDVAGASPSAKPFVAAFDQVWRLLESLGWQTAQGPGTEFVSMPGTQFFNFRPNINVFDSKGKACWKWLAQATEKETVDIQEESVWETLWTIAEKEFGWYTMSSGNETWYVKPNTSFTEFQPNVTIFQTKKRAVLQALAVHKVKIDLGDSVEGKQVIEFGAKPKAKKEKTSETPNKHKEKSDSFTTPPPKKSSSSTSSGKKSTPTSSKKSTKSSGSTKKAIPSAKKSNKSPKSAKKKQEEKHTPKAETPLQFRAPEFKVTFASIYKKLQERGWHHKPGAFEYDYFSPDYTKETQILNGNFFQSAAEFEGFLKDSGMWADIEAELRDEHTVLVEELRQEAEEKRQKQKERNAALKAKAKATPPKETKTPRSPLKKKKSVFQASVKADIAAVESAGTKRDAAGEVKITMGKVVEKLLKRGWHYKPGRFEYDYFKPNVTVKNGTPGEDYFQSIAELETYLKTSGLWDEISYEIRNEGDNETDEDSDDNKSKKATPPAKKQRAESQPVKSPQEEKRTESEPLEPAVAAISNDIWGNSHQINFEKY